MIDPLNLFFISTTIIGIIFTIYYGRKSIELEKSKKKLEWSDSQSCANDLGSKLKQKKGFCLKLYLLTDNLNRQHIQSKEHNR